MLPVSLWMLINSYWFNHWLEQHWQCQVTFMGVLWGGVGLVHWPVAVLRQGRLHKWDVLSPSLMKIWTSLIGRQRLCSLYGDQKWAERALNVNSLCSPHVRVGAKKGRGRRAEGAQHTPDTELWSRGHFIRMSWRKMKRAQDLEPGNSGWVLLLSNLSQKQISWSLWAPVFVSVKWK